MMRLMFQVSWGEFKFSRASLFCFGKSVIWSVHHSLVYIFTSTERLIIVTVRERFFFDYERKI